MASPVSNTLSVGLSVKWGKQVIEIANFDVTLGVQGLKSELAERTGVPVTRQKLLAKSKGLWKGLLKDDVDFGQLDWKSAASPNATSTIFQILLMGSAEQVKSPATKTVFLEDLPAEQIAQVVEPAGLVNLGNTCYLNSVVQCLRAVPELQKGLASEFSSSASSNPASAVLLRSLQETYQQLNRQHTPVQPLRLVTAVKMAFPQFAQLTSSGHPMQQDAEEFYSGLLSHMEEPAANRLFGIQMIETLTCDECPDEAVVTATDWHRKLVCNIQGGSDHAADTNVNYIAEGITLGLQGKIEKQSDVLGRNAIWTRQQKLSKLPPVLTVQFGRFFWKATPDSQDHAGVKCKVMKPVAFGVTLDVYEFCDSAIQAVLKQRRAKALAEQEEAIAKKLKGEDGVAMDANTTTETKSDAKMDDSEGLAGEDEEQDEDLQSALAMSLETNDTSADNAASAAVVLGPDIPSTFQGHYELFAVVTHKGRDADGGHYMAWVKSEHQHNAKKIVDSDILNEDWFVFDDDEVSPCKTDDVLKLKGGGDWHMSYLNFYRIQK
jgi:ubiquitin carboxyl-terminal hydrolase 14